MQPVKTISIEGNAIKIHAIALLLAALGTLTYHQIADQRTATAGAADMILMIITALAVVVLHELAHGAAFSYYGGNVKYGVGINKKTPYAYATSEKLLKPNQMIVVALAPLITISGLTLLLSTMYSTRLLFIAYIVNLIGASADLYMSIKLVQYDKTHLVKDTAVTLTIYKTT